MLKTSLFAALILVASLVYSQDKTETLTNADIISLTKVGLDKSVIVSKIEGSRVAFDVSTDGLVKLGRDGVDPKVINAMMDAQKLADAEQSVMDNTDNPLFLHNSGFYVYSKLETEKPLIKIDPSSISNYSTSGGGFGGFGKSSTVAHLTGAKSKMPVSDASAEFYFHLNPNDDSGTSWWWEGLSPNEFVLVKLRDKDGDRVFVLGSTTSGGFSSSSKTGIPAEDIWDFEYKEMEKGIYKITYPKALEAGEYMFMCTEATAEVYTFSIR